MCLSLFTNQPICQKQCALHLFSKTRRQTDGRVQQLRARKKCRPSADALSLYLLHAQGIQLPDEESEQPEVPTSAEVH